MTSRLADEYPFGTCSVCQRAATGCHYGAITCEACKGFFKRSQVIVGKTRTAWQFFQCIKNSKCDPATQLRARCKKCRYTRCIENGMSVEAVRRGRRPDVIRYGETSLLKVDPASSSPSTRRSSSTSVFDKYNSLQTAQDDSDVSPERTSVVEFYSSESATYSSSCQEYSCGPHSPWSHSVPSLPQDRPIIHRQEPHDRLLGNPHLKSNVSVIVYRDRRAL